MAGAAELPRPGVEVVQEFRSISPTIVTPTLVPCNIGPFFEVIEALDADGNVNPNARLADSYEQVNLVLSQSSLPSPRGNIDEVNVLEDSIRVFFEFGGSLPELSRSEGFLINYIDPDVATRPSMTGTVAGPSFAGLDGRTLILQFDSHTALPVTDLSLPVAADVTVVLSAAVVGGNMTITEIVAQINALFPGVASIGVGGDANKLKLTSTNYGAHASVVVRAEGSTNTILGFSAVEDTVAVGSGFYCDDDSDGDNTSPWLKIYAGTSKKLLSAPDVPVLGSLPDFVVDKIESGDTVVADGVDIGAVEVSGSAVLTMEVEQAVMSADSPFAPRRIWVQANNLAYPPPVTSTQGTVTGTVQTADETQAFVVGLTAAVPAPTPASETFSVNVTVDGVAQPTQIISSGAGWANLAAAIAGINGQALNFEAYGANDQGDQVSAGTYLGLRTKSTNKGSGGGLTYTAQTSGMNLGFTTPPYGDVGENVRFAPGTPAIAVGAVAFGSGAGPLVLGESVTYTPKVKNVDKPAETVPTAGWSASHADSAVGLIAAIVDWNSNALYTQAYRATNTGAPSATGLYFAVRTLGENIGAGVVTASRHAAINVTATDSKTTLAVATTNGTDTDLANKEFKWSIDLNARIFTVNLVEDEDVDVGGVSLQQVIDAINALTPNVASASTASPPFLKLTSQKYGGGSEIKTIDGTANTGLGFTDNTSYSGTGRPAPDLAIDPSGNVIVQSQILRDALTGLPFDNGFAPVVIAYKGLRLDLSPEADNPSLLVISDIDTLEEAADPISTDNPGSLMCYLSLLNAPTVSVAAIGVPEISADAPEGTPLGYAKCFEFLQSEEVYAISCASHLAVVHQNGLTHVNAMSEPEQKGERILFFNPLVPDRAQPTTVGSGTDANSTSTANEITVEVNLAPALSAAGIDPNIDINPVTGAIVNEVYLDLGDDDQMYLVQRVNGGTTVKLRTTFAAGENPDAFYSTTPVGTTISDDWSVFIRGELLLIPGTTKPDRTKISETVQAVAQAYGFRRGYYVFPDQVGINVTGLEQVVPAYYGASCVIGMIAELQPQQGFTNYPITGLTKVVGSDDSFTESQLNVMAAGGVYILVQDAVGAPVICRHQLSTDMTSIETRELSITKVVDYVAKFMRTGLRQFIGRSNITQPFLDQLGTVIQGQLGFLTESGVLIGADINNIIQDSTAPDTVLVDVTLDVPYPCNYIRLTLVI